MCKGRCAMKNKPIGLIDSGVGGLTVMKEAIRQLPNETFLYVGDTSRCPYGPRPKEEVLDFTWDMVHFLLKKDIKMLVIACNTATAVALSKIKEKLSIPVIGVIQPGSLAAIKTTKNKHIGVIGTEGTIKSNVYKETIQIKSGTTKVSSLACPTFVTMVEENNYSDKNAELEVSKVLEPLANQKIDTLILGCTHFPLLRPLIQEVVGKDVELIDSGAETVALMSTILDYEELNGEPSTLPRHHQYYTTGEVTPFRLIAEKWLEVNDLDIEHIDL